MILIQFTINSIFLNFLIHKVETKKRRRERNGGEKETRERERERLFKRQEFSVYSYMDYCKFSFCSLSLVYFVFFCFCGIFRELRPKSHFAVGAVWVENQYFHLIFHLYPSFRLNRIQSFPSPRLLATHD